MSSALWNPVSMKQLACPSKPASSGSPARKRRMLSTRVSPSKWVTEPAFEPGTLAASPITKTFGRHLRLQGVLVGGHEVELVAEARGSPT